MSENDATGVSAQEELFSDGSDLPPALQFTTTHDDITIEGAVVGVPKHSAHGGGLGLSVWGLPCVSASMNKTDSTRCVV
eukprot:m.79515 g.79515  ORF g.79515 m.79515 type:complete len:79 (-) comp14628_c0_seq7:66-302(-)